MNKLIVLFMAAVISFSIYADNIEISLIVVGNYNGNYDKLAQTEYSIQKAVGQNPKVIKISRGYRDWETDRKSTRLNSSHSGESRMPSSA